MGYSSVHAVTVKKVNPSAEKTEEEVFAELKANDDIGYAIGESNGENGDWFKAYDLESNLLYISLEYPEFSFLLNREWEDGWDITDTLFYCGRKKTKWLLPIPEITLDELE